MRRSLDPWESVRHSPLMRWLLLINLLAVVLLSGAVAIVIEGTQIGTASSSRDGRVVQDVGSPKPDTQKPITEGETSALTGTDETVSSGSGTAPRMTDDKLEPPQALTAEQPLGQMTDDDSLVAVPDAPIPLPAPRELAVIDLEKEEIESPGPPAADNDRSEVDIDLPPLKVATEGDFAPFNFIDDEGEPAGFDIDVAKELCRRLERQCVFEVRAWTDLVPSLRAGNVDLIAASMRIPSSRPAGVSFSNPYYGSRGRFVTSKGTGITGPGLLRAAGSQIAVQEASIHEAYLKEQYSGVELVATKSLAAALQLVSEGQVEAAFGDNAALLQWTKSQTCCVTLGEPISDATYFGEGIGLVVREEDQQLVELLNRHLQEMVSDGTSATLSERYFNGSIY